MINRIILIGLFVPILEGQTNSILDTINIPPYKSEIRLQHNFIIDTTFSILGNGVVIDPWALLDEIKEIKKKGIDVSPDNFMISESASLILPFHQEMDEIREDAAGKGKIGTTRRGIGPCYEDKVGRRSIRLMDLNSESNLDKRLDNILFHHNAIRKGLQKNIYKKDFMYIYCFFYAFCECN